MAQTTSLQWPNLFDVARNQVAVMEDNTSLVSRSRLLILSDPTSLYNDPQFGVGLRRFLWQYNRENTKAMIQDRIIEQLRMYEPCCVPDQTQFADGLLFTGDHTISTQEYNQLKMTVAITTNYKETVEVTINGDDINNG